MFEDNNNDIGNNEKHSYLYKTIKHCKIFIKTGQFRII